MHLPQNWQFWSEWDTKERTDKSMKNALYVQWYGKGTSWTEVTSNSEKTKPVALAFVNLHLSEGTSQPVSQSVVNSIKIP